VKEPKERRAEGVDWLRGRLRWEARLEKLRREASTPVPGPAAGGFIAPATHVREPVRAGR